jgi:hypothetical protein
MAKETSSQILNGAVALVRFTTVDDRNQEVLMLSITPRFPNPYVCLYTATIATSSKQLQLASADIPLLEKSEIRVAKEIGCSSRVWKLVFLGLCSAGVYFSANLARLHAAVVR